MERFDLVMSEDGRPYGVARNGPNIALPLRGSRGLRTRLAAIFADDHAGHGAVAVLRSPTRSPYWKGTPHGRTRFRSTSGWPATATASSSTSAPRTAGASSSARTDGASRAARRSCSAAPRSPRSCPIPCATATAWPRSHGLLNADETAFRLLVGWMVSTLIPEIPHPILAFKGEQGTGKTDGRPVRRAGHRPVPAPLRTAPRDVKQWVVVASASWAVCLDNVNAISGWLSETLCRAVTGDGNVDRALYTDDDVTVLAFRRVVMMTTIDAGHLDGDLAERLLLIELQPMTEGERRTDAELTAAYLAAQPSIFASLLDLTAKVLKRLPDVTARIHAAHGRLRLRPPGRRRGDGLGHARRLHRRGRHHRRRRARRRPVRQGGRRHGPQAARAHGQAQPGSFSSSSRRTSRRRTGRRTPPAPRGRLKRIAPVLRQARISFDDSERQPEGNRSRLYTLAVIAGRLKQERGQTPAPAAPAAPGTAADLQEHAGASAGAGE